MTATRTDIMNHLIDAMPISNWINGNWGLHEDRKFWDVTETTYINGVIMIIDLDYQSGYLLQIVERDTSTLSYMVVVLKPDGHDSEWYPHDAGTFFDSEIETEEVCQWAVKKIYGLLEGW